MKENINEKINEKNVVNSWTDKQIADNPLSYMASLASNLNKDQSREEIEKTIAEIERVKSQYFPHENERTR